MASVEAGKENGACAALFALISLDLWSSLRSGSVRIPQPCSQQAEGRPGRSQPCLEELLCCQPGICWSITASPKSLPAAAAPRSSPGASIHKCSHSNLVLTLSKTFLASLPGLGVGSRAQR